MSGNSATRTARVKWASTEDTAAEHSSHTGDLLGVPELAPDAQADTRPSNDGKRKSKFDAPPSEAEIFLFSYGTVVLWGMTEAQEKRFLTSLYVIFYKTLLT
jgi:hypothetical protein